MHTISGRAGDLHHQIAEHALEKKHLHEVTTLMAELRRLHVRHGSALNEDGIADELHKLEEWLEAERKGPAPACIISASGISWLVTIRDRLKLLADEMQRLEGEGGNPSSKEQIEKQEELLNATRRIDTIINDTSCTQKPH